MSEVKQTKGRARVKRTKRRSFYAATLYLTSPAADRGISVRELFINVPLRQIESYRETVRPSVPRVKSNREIVADLK